MFGFNKFNGFFFLSIFLHFLLFYSVVWSWQSVADLWLEVNVTDGALDHINRAPKRNSLAIHGGIKK